MKCGREAFSFEFSSFIKRLLSFRCKESEAECVKQWVVGGDREGGEERFRVSRNTFILSNCLLLRVLSTD